MKRLVFGLLLLGCGKPPDAAPTAAPTTVVSATSTPLAATSPAEKKVDLSQEGLSQMTASHVDGGMTNQARIDNLMMHLAVIGKSRLVANWDVYDNGEGSFDVSYVITTIAKNAPQPSESPSDNRAPREGGKSRPDPFSRPKRAKAPDDALVLIWTLDPAKGVCLPKDERTRALLALQPKLDSLGLDAVLPDKWRVEEPIRTETVEVAPVQTPTPAPVATATPAPVEAQTPAPATAAQPATPIRFEGFIGTGSERRAIISRGSEHFELAPGQVVSGFKVKSISGDELILQRGPDTLTLMPGEAWEPFLSPHK